MTDIAFTCMNEAHISERHIEAKPSLLARFRSQAQLWRERSQARNALAQFSAHDLKDIGLTEAQAVYEINKPFWSA